MSSRNQNSHQLNLCAQETKTPTSRHQPEEKKDFFISYNKADLKIAEWIAWVLEKIGNYSTIIQAWDFHPGCNFVLEMQNASLQSEKTIAVLSQAYLDALFTHPEWAAAFSKDPTGKNETLIPVRVDEIDVPGMLGNIVYIDLVGLEKEGAKKKLLEKIGCTVNHKRMIPDKEPEFTFIPPKADTRQTVRSDTSSVLFEKLRLGSTDELVGRQDSLKWLDDKLLKSNGVTCALASLHGMGGMGKTFLSQVFAEKNKAATTILPVYLGETSPFNAGIQLLQNMGGETSHIDTNEKLAGELQRYFRSGNGILILDDIRTVEVEMLLPRTAGWSVLVTTRDKKLARKLCGDKNVKELDVLCKEDAILLMQKVLKDNFIESQRDDYEKLCEHLSYRPYSVRLAAGYLLNALDPCPLKLLQKLKAGKYAPVDDDLDFKNIQILLEDCLDQLKRKSPLAVKLVYALSVGADQGMPLERFVQWHQTKRDGYDEEDIESALTAARDSGIILVEKETGDGQERRKLRLHTDLLRLLRKVESRETVNELIAYLDDLLVKRIHQTTLDRLMYLQVFSLVERYKEDVSLIRALYVRFWIPLWSTGELKQAFELGELFTGNAVANEDKYDLQASYGNQALILKAWGRLEEAMELLKKQEAICTELGNRNSLQICYGNQAVILKAWGRLDEAMDLHKKEEAICNELGNRNSLQICYGNQALILKAWGRLEEAMELHKKQEAICNELGNRDGLSKSYSGQGLILYMLCKYEEAMVMYQKEETLCEDLGDKNGLQRSYGNQALILQAWGRLDEAMELLNIQETICIEVGLKPILKWCYQNQIDLYKKMKKPNAAKEAREKLAKLEGEMRG